MKTSKKVSTGILKHVFNNVPVSMHSHIQCFFLIYIEFPAYQLAGSLCLSFTLPRCQVKYIKLGSALLIYPTLRLLCLLDSVLNLQASLFWCCCKLQRSNWNAPENKCTDGWLGCHASTQVTWELLYVLTHYLWNLPSISTLNWNRHLKKRNWIERKTKMSYKLRCQVAFWF